jgi:hypothetical protein
VRRVVAMSREIQMSHRGIMIATVVLGLASGFAGTLLGAPLLGHHKKTEASSPPSPAESQGRPVGRSDALAAWLDKGLEQRLAALEAKRRAGEDESSNGSEGASPALGEGPQSADVASAREETLARWSERLRDHDAEPVDRAWSDAATASLQKDVGDLAEAEQFDLVAVKCKSHTCSATVQWPDYGRAVQGYTSLLHHSYEASGTREVLLPEPENREQRYQATVLYDYSASLQDP